MQKTIKMNGLNSVITGQRNERLERYEQNEKKHLRLKEDSQHG